MKSFVATLLLLSRVVTATVVKAGVKGKLRGRELQFDWNDIFDPSIQGLCGSLGNPPCEDDEDSSPSVPTDNFLFGDTSDWSCYTDNGQDKCKSNVPLCLEGAGVDGQDLCADLVVWNYRGRVDASSTYVSGAGDHDGLYLLVHFLMDDENKISLDYTPNAILDNGSTGRKCKVEVCTWSDENPDSGLQIDCSEYINKGRNVAKQCQPMENIFFNVISNVDDRSRYVSPATILTSMVVALYLVI